MNGVRGVASRLCPIPQQSYRSRMVPTLPGASSYITTSFRWLCDKNTAFPNASLIYYRCLLCFEQKIKPAILFRNNQFKTPLNILHFLLLYTIDSCQKTISEHHGAVAMPNDRYHRNSFSWTVNGDGRNSLFVMLQYHRVCTPPRSD